LRFYFEGGEIVPELIIKNFNLYYEECGEGETDLVLIHGLGSDVTAWSVVTPILSKFFRLILPDLRGHGRSTAGDGPFAISALADDVVCLLDHINVKRANILGSSMGGMVAQCLGIYHPERVQSLIIANSESHIAPRLRMIIENWIFLAGHMGYRTYIENTIPWVYTESFFNDHEAQIKSRIDELAARSVPAFIQAAKAVLDHDVTQLLSRIAAPTLIISSEFDTLSTKEYAELMLQHIPNAQLEVISDTGHMAIIERPNEFCEIILSFLGPKAN
jgi:3-oxoadipate enol-lactonase